MRKSILILATLFSSSALAGIIGIGGTNANENPELLQAYYSASKFDVLDKDFRRLSVRIGERGLVNAEVTSTDGKKLRSDFIKVYVNGEGEIVDKNVTTKLAPTY